ncbi:Odorant receptor 22c, partial [Pseudolycoriella hygida]
KTGWKIIGFWPGNHASKFQIALAVTNCMEILFYSVFQLMYCYTNLDNLVLLLDALTPVLTQIVSAIKVLIIVKRRNDTKSILDYLKQLFVLDKDAKSLKIRNKASFVSLLFALTLCIFANLTNLFFCLLPTVKDSYRLLTGVKRSYDLPFKAVFPFDVFWSPLFEFIFITSVYSGVMTSAAIYSTDGLFLGMCSHISGEFRIIGSRISTLVEQEISDSHEFIEGFTSEQNGRLSKKLKKIVKDHNNYKDC